MGRPRKRQKTDDESPPSLNTQDREIPESQAQGSNDFAIDPEIAAKDLQRTEFENTCSTPISQSIRRAATRQRAGTPRTSYTSTTVSARTPADGDGLQDTQYPTDMASWPDFGDMTMLPVLVTDGHKKDHTVPFSIPHGSLSSGPHSPHLDPESLSNLPSIPECPCLPNSYLTLSTLSALSAFPVASGTVDTLLSAHRVAKDSIYCAVCPEKFQSGSQNVMLNSVLINVLADHWHRVRKASAQDLKKGFGSTSEDDQPGSLETSELDVLEDLEWRTFGHQLMRAYVFGDTPIPSPPGGSLQKAEPQYASLTLMDVFSSFERRQNQWHKTSAWSGEFSCPLRTALTKGHSAGMTLEEVRTCHSGVHDAKLDQENGDFLCLKIVDGAKRVVMSLDVGAPRIEV
ncbi:hypothetical protein B0A52_04240 [Exophiala mesophila]|uniref:Uncharacterized protein n=1 Tax=Exophiala mesophila TaxID=212818 RepID=A0A438N7V0_EXOME|nr:hypothetical protein B0A52_04240 [Exophiala mesophila]